MQQQIGIVIKKHPDGYAYVPFDQVDGQEHPHRAHFLRHLTDTGHTFELLVGGAVKLLTGPHALA